MKRKLPEQYELKRLFDYDANTGAFTWKARSDVPPIWNRKCAGKQIGTPTEWGYLRGGVHGRLYYVHRLVWKWTYDQEPQEIDHINGDPLDNRIANLRAASGSQNCCNRRRLHTKILPKGVVWHKCSQKFISAIQIKGCRRVHLGLFETAEEAGEAYRTAAQSLHGAFARFE